LEGVQCFAERLDWRRREHSPDPSSPTHRPRRQVQGFVKEEDEAFKNMGAAYEKASGNKIELAGTADVSSWHSATCCVAPADGRFRIKADSRKSSSRTNL